MEMSDLENSTSASGRESKEDVIDILLAQHSRIRELFTEVKGSDGGLKKRTFDELRALLATHETGEELILRPVSGNDAGNEVADALNHEEENASRQLADLEKMDPVSAEFDRSFAAFEQAVLGHAQHEETEEFPAVREREDPDKLVSLGRIFRAAERIGPTHPHPSTAGSPAAQWTIGPFASLLDRARDAIKEVTHSR
jgi:hypothetical protein